MPLSLYSPLSLGALDPFANPDPRDLYDYVSTFEVISVIYFLTGMAAPNFVGLLSILLSSNFTLPNLLGLPSKPDLSARVASML